MSMASDKQQQDSGHAGVRLDLWLWAARFFKTRALAKRAIEAGKVEVNAQPGKPATRERSDSQMPMDVQDPRTLDDCAATHKQQSCGHHHRTRVAPVQLSDWQKNMHGLGRFY